MDQEDPDGPDPSLVQYRSSPTGLPNLSVNLEVDRRIGYCT